MSFHRLGTDTTRKLTLAFKAFWLHQGKILSTLTWRAIRLNLEAQSLTIRWSTQ